jgi:hypothetical protein
VYFAELGLVYGDELELRGDGGRDRVGFLAEFFLSVCEIAFFEERTVSFVGVVPAKRCFIIF